MQNKIKNFLVIALFLILFVIDFISKLLADSLLVFGEKIILIKNIVSLEKVYNTGAAFGIFSNMSLILMLISTLVSLIIIYCLFSEKFKKTILEYISLVFILSGAFGNIFDRIYYKHVIDFISLEFINFPVFNFADICINIGVISLLIIYLFGTNNDNKKIYKN